MKKVIHNISSILMAFVVLFSTMSFTINMHYCGTTLVNVALYKEAKSCAMEMGQQAPFSSQEMNKKSCCTDKQLHFEGQDELKTSFDKLTFDQQIYIASFFYTYVNLFKSLEENSIPFKEYPPPLLVKDIHLLNETFLI